MSVQYKPTISTHKFSNYNEFVQLGINELHSKFKSTQFKFSIFSDVSAVLHFHYTSSIRQICDALNALNYGAIQPCLCQAA